MNSIDQLAAALAERRKSLGLSLQDVADRMGNTKRQTIHNWEIRRTDVPSSRLRRWARALGYELSWSLSEIQHAPPTAVEPESDETAHLLARALRSLSPEERERLIRGLE